MGETLYNTIEEIQKGDKEKMLELINKFNPIIKKLSRRLYYEEAETDLIIAFIEIINLMKLHKFNCNSEGMLISYINNVMKNKHIDLFRKNVLRKKEEVEINFDILRDKTDQDIECNVFMDGLLNILPELQRKIIKEKYIKDYSDVEIAKKLNITRQAVNRAKNRAIKTLRDYLITT